MLLLLFGLCSGFLTERARWTYSSLFVSAELVSFAFTLLLMTFLHELDIQRPPPRQDQC